MKRIISFVLVLCVVFSLTSCSNSKPDRAQEIKLSDAFEMDKMEDDTAEPPVPENSKEDIPEAIVDEITEPDANDGSAIKGGVFDDIQVYDIIEFGSYEQDNDTADGKEPLNWLVLEVKDDSALLLCQYCIDTQPFAKEKEPTTWKESNIRRWVNNEFYNDAFSEVEKDNIIVTAIYDDENEYYPVTVDEATQDGIFLLNVSEAEHYFASDADRKALPTDYAIAQGIGRSYVREGDRYSGWWLRSIGESESKAALVTAGGDIMTEGDYVTGDGTGIMGANLGVRPALWVRCTSSDVAETGNEIIEGEVNSQDNDNSLEQNASEFGEIFNEILQDLSSDYNALWTKTSDGSSVIRISSNLSQQVAMVSFFDEEEQLKDSKKSFTKIEMTMDADNADANAVCMEALIRAYNPTMLQTEARLIGLELLANMMVEGKETAGKVSTEYESVEYSLTSLLGFLFFDIIPVDD